MSKQIPIPKGWTYLVHGTNTGQWKNEDIEAGSFSTKDNMSFVENSKLQEELSTGSGTTSHYASKGEGTPFEIRCLIYQNWRNYSKVRQELQGRLSPSELKEVDRYYNSFAGRHEAVPKNTRLVKIAKSKNDLGNDVLWYVPEQFLEHYLSDYRNQNIENDSVEVDEIIDFRREIKPPEKETAKNTKPSKIDTINQYIDTQYGESGSLSSASFIKDDEIKKQIMESAGMPSDLSKKIDIAMIKVEDKENDDYNYMMCIMDDQGRIKNINSRLNMVDKDSNVAIKQGVTFDGQVVAVPAKAEFAWKLKDGKEIVAYSNSQGKLNAGIGEGRNILNPINTSTLESQALER